MSAASSLPWECQRRGSLKISLVLGKISTGNFFAPLGSGEAFKRGGGDIQDNFPFPCAVQGKIEVAGGQTGLHIVGKTHLCLLLLVPTLQNAHVFQIVKLASHLNLLSASCAISVGVGKE